MVCSDLGMPRRKTVIEAVLALGGEGILRQCGMRVFILEEWDLLGFGQSRVQVPGMWSTRPKTNSGA